MTEPKLPKIFLDRCLGNFQLPAALRKAGINLITHDEYYGKIAGQNIADTEWLALAGNNGWAAFTKDRKILKNKKKNWHSLTTKFNASVCLGVLIFQHLRWQEGSSLIWTTLPKPASNPARSYMPSIETP